jgi:hypothetical protein
MELDDIKKIIEELDRGISKVGAAVRLDTCDPNDLYVTATQNGYLRIGVEFLKAAFAPQQTSDSESRLIQVDTEYLITKDSSTDFSSFERVDEIVEESQEDSLSDSIVMYLILAVLIAIPIFAVIGLISLLRMLYQSY